MLSDMKYRKFNSWSFSSPMSAKFLPDDNKDEDAEALAIKEAEEAERLKNREEFDKERQLLDQKVANAVKVATAQATQQLEEQQTANESMRTELDELRAKATDQGINLNEEDYDPEGAKLVKAIKVLEEKLEAGDKAQVERIAKLEKTRDDLLAEREVNKAKSASNAVYEQLLTDLDGDYGQQHRNAALKEFDALRADGKVPTNNVSQATRIMEKCYKNAVKAADKDAKDNPQRGLSLDPGSGGGSPNLNRPKLKAGSLAEVSAQMKASAGVD